MELLEEVRFLKSHQNSEKLEQIRKIIHLLKSYDTSLSFDETIIPYLDISTLISWIEKSETASGYSGDYLDALTAIFSVLKHDRDLPYLKGLIHNFEQINEGTYGKIYAAKERHGRTLFLMKRNNVSRSNLIDYLSAFYHEVYVGRFLNKFRTYNPGIVQTFGSISCESPLFYQDPYIEIPPEKRLTDRVSYCPGFGKSSEHYIIVENVTDRDRKQSLTLHNFLTKREYGSVFIFALLLEILNTLVIINDECDFTHNDLHLGNILLQHIDEVTIFVKKMENDYDKVRGNCVPRIIDCANAYLKNEHGEFWITNEFIGTTNIHCPFRDFVKVIFGLYGFAVNYANDTTKRMLEIIYANSGRNLPADFHLGVLTQKQQVSRGFTNIFAVNGGYLTESATRKYADITFRDMLEWLYIMRNLMNALSRENTPFSSACAIEPGCIELERLRQFIPESNPTVEEAQKLTQKLTDKMRLIRQLQQEILDDAITTREALQSTEGYNENKDKYAIVKLESLVDEILSSKDIV